MLFFKLLTAMSALLASLAMSFNRQVLFNFLFSISMLITLFYYRHFVFAFAFLVMELLFNKLIILSNNNSQNKNFPSFKIFKKDFKKIIIIVFISIIYGHTYLLIQGNGAAKTYKLLYEYDLFLKGIPLLLVALLILIISKWSNND